MSKEAIRDHGGSMSKPHTRPMAVATLVLAAGVATSLAGNLQAIHLDNARPGVGAHVSAIIWPLFLFASIEVLLHTPWLVNWRDRLTKGLAIGLVGAVAAYVSYFHLAHVLSNYGYDRASRYAGPLAIDACMAMATLALNRVGQARRAVASVRPAEVATGEPAEIVSHANAADEAESYIRRLAAELDSTTTPAVPVSVTAIGPSLEPQRKRAARMTPEQAQEAQDLARIGREHDLPAGHIAALLAGWYGVSPRTIYRTLT